MAAFLVSAFTASSSLWIDFLRFVINPLLLASWSYVSLLRVLITASAFSISFVKSERSTASFSFVVCLTQRPLIFYFKTTSKVLSFAVWSLFLVNDCSIFYFKVEASA